MVSARSAAAAAAPDGLCRPDRRLRWEVGNASRSVARARWKAAGARADQAALRCGGYWPRKTNIAIASRRMTSSARPWVRIAPCM